MLFKMKARLKYRYDAYETRYEFLLAVDYRDEGRGSLQPCRTAPHSPPIKAGCAFSWVNYSSGGPVMIWGAKQIPGSLTGDLKRWVRAKNCRYGHRLAGRGMAAAIPEHISRLINDLDTSTVPTHQEHRRRHAGHIPKVSPQGLQGCRYGRGARVLTANNRRRVTHGEIFIAGRTHPLPVPEGPNCA